MPLRLLIIFLLIYTGVALAGCGGSEKVSPEISKEFLKVNGYGFTTKEFFRALKSGEPAIINGFIDAGMDPNSKNDRGLTALTFAILNDDLKTIKVVAKRADINLKDERGNGPLHLAIARKNREAVDYLLQAKADVNVTGKDGQATNQSPLYAALLADDMELFKKLLDKGADPNIADSEGAFPLSEASIRNGADVETVRLLIEKGADVNKVENNGASPLIYAAQNSGIDVETRKAIIRLLLKNGADKSLKDKTGKTALDWAKETGHTEMVEILK
ncbi:MAG: ankyrin repeat domain-containing protein [Acidobacteriota bacterium]|nr:ankyrin repeat domain-containing protein [Acidobacteriota bacterium]